MSKHTSERAEKKKKSSLDYPLLARKLLEASGDEGISKLPAGLYIIATPIGHTGDISLRALVTLASADAIACEDTRNSGLLLAKYGIKKRLISYHDHNADDRRPDILKLLTEGKAIALISDAGMPVIADPGYKLVRSCHDEGFDVTVIPGANAAITALAGSGIPTDQFLFAGFLPPKSAARQKTLADLKSIHATLVFYEAPQRLSSTLLDMVKILGKDRPAAIARELTKLFEETRRGKLGEIADYYAEADIKGEIVIIIGAALADSEPQYDLEMLLKEYLDTMSVRDAVDAASSITGVRKSEVYARALSLSGKNNT